jgi:hypothetical protein
MFGSSYLHFFVGGLLSYLRLFTDRGVQHILCCVFVLFLFVLCPVYPMLPVSQDCLSFNAPLVVSNVYLYLVQNMICASGIRITKKTEMI